MHPSISCSMYSTCTIVTAHILFTINSPFLTCTYLSHTRCSSIMLQYHTLPTYKVLQPFIHLCLSLYIYIHTSYIQHLSQYFYILIPFFIICPCTSIKHLIHISHARSNTLFRIVTHITQAQYMHLYCLTYTYSCTITHNIYTHIYSYFHFSFACIHICNHHYFHDQVHSHMHQT